MTRRRWLGVALALGLASAGPTGCGGEAPDDTLRIGHFPNVTHAQGVIAHARSRAGGWLEARTGVRSIEWYVFNAGPSAMEALLAGRIDATYVGPNPAINAHLKSGGDDVRVVAGACRGGSALVVREGSTVRDAAGFRGKRLATPQLGNTQDVSARAWLAAGGLKVTQTGGDADVVPAANPDQLSLFQRGDVEGVWTVEPWVSRLVVEAKGRVLLEETDALTTVLVMRKGFLDRRRDVARRLVEAHAELTRWIAEHPDEARAEAAGELLAETRSPLPPGVLEPAWARLRFESEVGREPFDDFLRRAQSAGFLRDAGSLDRLVERP